MAAAQKRRFAPGRRRLAAPGAAAFAIDESANHPL